MYIFLIIYSFENIYFCTPSQPSLYKGRMAANSSEENSSSQGGNTNREMGVTGKEINMTMEVVKVVKVVSSDHPDTRDIKR